MSFNKFFTFCCYLLMSLTFSSCNDGGELVQTWSYDESLLNQMESKWNNQNLLNYSFEYSISDVIPDAVIGIVTIKEGASSVELTINGLSSGDEGYEAELNRYLEKNIKISFNSINEIYSYVKYVVDKRKQEYKSKKLIHYILNINYDSENPVPSLIDETLFYKEDLTEDLINGNWNGELNFKIYNFSID